MKTISKLKYVFFLLVIAGFVSCKGEIGPPGADGADGIDGTDGTDGNANVTSSDWITPTWSETLPAISANYAYETDDITEDIINTGVVLSFCDWDGSGSSFYSVPFSYGTSYRVNFYFKLSSGQIMWIFNAENPHTPHAMLFRYVIIPSSGSKSADSQQAIYDELDNAGVDISKYEEVMDYYGLEY